jgi:hypothetical protein
MRVGPLAGASPSVKKVYSYPLRSDRFLGRQGLRQNPVATAAGDARHAAFPFFPEEHTP